MQEFTLRSCFVLFSPIVMAAFKRRKVDSECRAFNEEWGEKYFFVEIKNQKATCVICTESVAVLKEDNLRHHYETKHLSTYLKLSGKFRTEKFESMKRVFESQKNLFGESLLKMNLSLVQVTK
ncbi:general transcription factor II-I repeat domain-containing protein 2-like isoform X2 [Tachypleus tridentatus]|uniref:general transcription factor II-I repeat domain-containing protein 2-like isoform X2 n=1 Tax=Tachypleus tridentatus TaxID=6853 RepID=UPI003FD5EAC5